MKKAIYLDLLFLLFSNALFSQSIEDTLSSKKMKKDLEVFKNIRFKDYYVILLENNEQPDQTLEKIISELNNFNLPQEVHIQFMQLSESGVYKTVRKGISKKWLDQIILRLKLKNF